MYYKYNFSETDNIYNGLQKLKFNYYFIPYK